MSMKVRVIPVLLCFSCVAVSGVGGTDAAKPCESRRGGGFIKGQLEHKPFTAKTGCGVTSEYGRIVEERGVANSENPWYCLIAYVYVCMYVCIDPLS